MLIVEHTLADTAHNKPAHEDLVFVILFLLYILYKEHEGGGWVGGIFCYTFYRVKQNCSRQHSKFSFCYFWRK